MKPIRTLFFFSLCLTAHLGFSQVGSSNLDSIIHIEWEIPPEFPGGYEKMLEYLKENKRNVINPRTQSEYTKDEQRKSEKVIVRFIVTENGSVTNVVLEVGLPHCEACNQEALHLVESMPNWKPAELNGKIIYNYVRLPIIFELEPENEPFTECMIPVVAEFPGGDEKLREYIQKNVKWIGNPKRKKSIPKEELLIGGRVIVLFQVEADGQLTHVELEEKLPHCEPCNQEALRVVKKMPPWKPSYEKGKAVSTCIRLPIYFDFN
jgi:TonB family protein